MLKRAPGEAYWRRLDLLARISPGKNANPMIRLEQVILQGHNSRAKR